MYVNASSRFIGDSRLTQAQAEMLRVRDRAGILEARFKAKAEVNSSTVLVPVASRHSSLE